MALATVACSLLAQAAFAEAAPPPKPLSPDLGNGVKMDFVFIPAGTLLMGDDKGDKDERPAHKVTIAKPFYFGKYEVTQEQWQALMGENASLFKGARNPVESVSWDECQTFLAKLGEKFPGKKFRLPTEAEWEYACRAGTKTRFSFGDDEEQMRKYGWCLLNSVGSTSPVGKKLPNPWGLYDVHGNVWEWCQDWYGPYDKADPKDPTGPATGEFRVVRGGSWFKDMPSNLRSAARYRAKPDTYYHNVGLRVLLAP
jgi:formylglycine-generating enzyme required for sulfatase activity